MKPYWDAIAKVNGLPAVSSKKKIWVARAYLAGQVPKVLPVDWKGVTECGSSSTNYQIFPGDRVYVQSDAWIRADTWLSKRLSPVLRGLGATLLGASTVNSIKNGSSSGLGGVNGISGIRGSRSVRDYCCRVSLSPPWGEGLRMRVGGPGKIKRLYRRSVAPNAGRQEYGGLASRFRGGYVGQRERRLVASRCLPS